MVLPNTNFSEYILFSHLIIAIFLNSTCRTGSKKSKNILCAVVVVVGSSELWYHSLGRPSPHPHFEYDTRYIAVGGDIKR